MAAFRRLRRTRADDGRRGSCAVQRGDETLTEVDALIVGGGVTGLASALTLARSGRSVCVLEAHARPGLETSTHNSGVIHAGLYYPPGSLKARLCIEGRDALYAFCDAHGVPYRRTGKLVVADDPSREHELDAIAANARANGARADIIRGRAIAGHDPNVRATIALWSPDTGIVDASQLVIALASHARAAGAAILTSTPLRAAAANRDGFAVGTSQEEIQASVVVNAAGLFADEVSAMLDGEAFRIWPCRGDYAQLTGSAADRVRMPIYPLPEKSGHGLGVHLTPTIGGGVLVGPTSSYQDSKRDYESGRPPLTSFLDSARKLVPSLSLNDLRDGGSGIRAKLHPERESYADFMIRPDTRHARLIHAAGIDSPGLTSCLAIGRLVAQLVTDALRR